MKFRNLVVVLAFIGVLAAGLVWSATSVEAVPNAPAAAYAGECGFHPYLTLGESCHGGHFLVGGAMSYSDCLAARASLEQQAYSNNRCDSGDFTFKCEAARWCLE